MDLTRPLAPAPYDLLPAVPVFILTSDDVRDGEAMDIRHSEDGGSVSPQLSWSGFPAATRSFAVSCFDADAPTPAGFWHWTLLNLPAKLHCLPQGYGDPDRPVGQGSMTEFLPPSAVKALNDGGTLGYFGAAPPAGDRAHRYFFAVHALDVDRLDVPEGIGCTPAAFQMLFHTIARAIIAPTYQR